MSSSTRCGRFLLTGGV